MAVASPYRAVTGLGELVIDGEAVKAQPRAVIRT
jgi:hypothetical protein